METTVTVYAHPHSTEITRGHGDGPNGFDALDLGGSVSIFLNEEVRVAIIAALQRPSDRHEHVTTTIVREYATATLDEIESEHERGFAQDLELDAEPDEQPRPPETGIFRRRAGSTSHDVWEGRAYVLNGESATRTNGEHAWSIIIGENDEIYAWFDELHAS